MSSFLNIFYDTLAGLLQNIGWSRASSAHADRIFRIVLQASLDQRFYKRTCVPFGTLQRLSVLFMHMFIVLKTLRNSNVANHMIKLMFDNIEVGMREQGIGDMGLGHKLNKLSSVFWGQYNTYSKLLASQTTVISGTINISSDELEKCLVRNILGMDPQQGVKAQAEMLVSYFASNLAHLANQEDLVVGTWEFLGIDQIG